MRRRAGFPAMAAICDRPGARGSLSELAVASSRASKTEAADFPAHEVAHRLALMGVAASAARRVAAASRKYADAAAVAAAREATRRLQQQPAAAASVADPAAALVEDLMALRGAAPAERQAQGLVVGQVAGHQVTAAAIERMRARPGGSAGLWSAGLSRSAEARRHSAAAVRSVRRRPQPALLQECRAEA